MKQFLQFGIIVLVVFLWSCKKDISSGVNDNALVGKWNIVTDSSHAGVAADNHPVNYAGHTGDYFEFKPDDKLFIEENNNLSVLDYAITSDSTLTITSFLPGGNGETENCTITCLPGNNIIISTFIFATPGGTFGRKVELNK